MRIRNDRKAQIAAIAIMSVIALIFLIQTYGKAHRPQGFDLTSYLVSAQALMHGENPYDTGSAFPYLYPLFLAFSLIPLVILPYWLAVFLWYVASILSLILATRILINLVGEEFGIEWGPGLYVPLAGLCVLLSPMLQNNLLNGQVNFIVLALCVLFLKFHLDRRDALSAFMLAMAISIKIVPAILLLFLLVRRRFASAFLAVFFAAVLCWAPALLLGEQAATVYSEWIRHMATLASTESPVKGTMFFTLDGFLTYLLPGLAGSVAAKAASVFAVIVATVGLDVYSRIRPTANCDTWAFSEYLLATLLVLPISETHHLALLIPAALLITLRSGFTSGLSKIQVYAVPGLFFLLFWIGKFDKNGPYFFFAIVLLFACVAARLASCRNANSRRSGARSMGP